MQFAYKTPKPSALLAPTELKMKSCLIMQRRDDDAYQIHSNLRPQSFFLRVTWNMGEWSHRVTNFEKIFGRFIGRQGD